MRAPIVVAAVAVMLAVPAGPVQAHGAVAEPISRLLACAPDGPYVESEVCAAALAASDRTAFDDWDYLHVAGVAGRDPELIPDGQLCSGGVAGFRGLDLADVDWPTTELVAGSEITFRYRVTIPHQGSFRFHVTRAGYDPGQPLRWSDLEAEPFLSVTDPEQVGDEYVIDGELPADRTGRHLIYTIWQNSDTPDTYYSCSDVVFMAPASPTPTTPAPSSRPSVTASAAGDPVNTAGYGTTAPDRSVDLLLTGGAAVVFAALLAGGLGLLRLRRSGRQEGGADGTQQAGRE